ncbi:hypothetical protein V4Y02_23820, partial [Escherichia coli]
FKNENQKITTPTGKERGRKGGREREKENKTPTLRIDTNTEDISIVTTFASFSNLDIPMGMIETLIVPSLFQQNLY